jgi:hypothetical protein
MARPPAPVIVDRVLEDPDRVRDLVTRHAPYWSVQRYFRNATEMASLRDGEAPKGGSGGMFVAPWFRGDWAYDAPLVDGVEVFLDNPRFRDAAAKVFGGAHEVRPQIVYVNCFAPIPAFDHGHVDIPAFRGIDRTRHPVWLLGLMLRSGLFEDWRIPIATGVACYYDGPGGGLHYWPDGPERPPVRRPALPNTAVVGDNDRMFHRVEAVGAEGTTFMKGLTLDSQLEWAGDAWAITDGGRTLARHPFEAVRVSVSWKAQVLRTPDEARRVDDHSDDLSLDAVVEAFRADLAARGRAVPAPDDPLTDEAFIAALNETYRLPRPLEA